MFSNQIWFDLMSFYVATWPAVWISLIFIHFEMHMKMQHAGAGQARIGYDADSTNSITFRYLADC